MVTMALNLVLRLSDVICLRRLNSLRYIKHDILQKLVMKKSIVSYIISYIYSINK